MSEEPQIGDYVRWDNTFTGGWIEGQLLTIGDRNGQREVVLCVVRSRGFDAGTIQKVIVGDFASMRRMDDPSPLPERLVQQAREIAAGASATNEMHPLCCGQSMRRSGMGGNAWICSKCEVYQGPRGARTPEQWWRRVEDGWSAWQLAQGDVYGSVPASDLPPARVYVTPPTQRPAPVVHFDRDLTPDQADAIIAEFERRGTARGPTLMAKLHEYGESQAPIQSRPQSVETRYEVSPRDVHEAFLFERNEPPRPDGFAQSAVDAAKAVLLSVGTGRARK